MKKLMLLVLSICLTNSVYAQSTIKFLGIPIDGTKREMISKLEAKGYEYNSYGDYLSGEFNGNGVQISVQTVNNEVWRIVVIEDLSTNETNIKIRFNKLFDQFSDNSKYFLIDGKRLDDSEDISYEMMVNNKRYDASFGLVDTSINGYVWYTIAEIYGGYKIAMFYENLDNAANGEDL